ncbi:MAG: glycosyltransferase family 2 protein [Chloroflexi bacterium]|nr:glycosyltransferase family 2 protein [Chloroflexota bacterium]
MPVYNEKETIEEILRRVAKVRINKEIVVVDDCSTDGTREILQKLSDNGEFHVLFHPVNRGKGAAIRTALENATGDIIIVQDADLEYDPSDYRKVLRPILTGKAKVVYGSRFLGEHKAMYFWHMVGNKLLTLITNILFDTTLTDMETCYKAFAAEVIKPVKIRSDRFEFEPEITAKVLKRGYRIYEVPISYAGREYNEGKKIGWKDFFGAVASLVRFRFLD